MAVIEQLAKAFVNKLHYLASRQIAVFVYECIALFYVVFPTTQTPKFYRCILVLLLLRRNLFSVDRFNESDDVSQTRVWAKTYCERISHIVAIAEIFSER